MPTFRSQSFRTLLARFRQVLSSLFADLWSPSQRVHLPRRLCNLESFEDRLLPTSFGLPTAGIAN